MHDSLSGTRAAGLVPSHGTSGDAVLTRSQQGGGVSSTSSSRRSGAALAAQRHLAQKDNGQGGQGGQSTAGGDSSSMDGTAPRVVVRPAPLPGGLLSGALELDVRQVKAALAERSQEQVRGARLHLNVGVGCWVALGPDSWPSRTEMADTGGAQEAGGGVCVGVSCRVIGSCSILH